MNRACTKRYLNYMGMLWERASAPEAKASVDRYAMGLSTGRTAAAAAGSSLGSESAAAAADANPSSAGAASWSAGQATAEAAYLAAMEQMRGMVTASPVHTSSGESPNRATGTQGLQQPAALASGDQEPWRAHGAKQQPTQAPLRQALGRAAQGPGQQQAAASAAWVQVPAELGAAGAAASSNLADEDWLLPSQELLSRLRQEMDFYEEESATPGTPSSLASAPSSTLSAPGHLVVGGTTPQVRPQPYASLHESCTTAGCMMHVLEHESRFAEVHCCPPCTHSSSICFLLVYCSPFMKSSFKFLAASTSWPSHLHSLLHLLVNHTSRLTMLMIPVMPLQEAYAGLKVGASPTTQSLPGSGLATPVPVSPGELSPLVSTPAGSVAGGLRSRRPWHWMPEMQ